MSVVRIEALPDEIRSRVMAATADATHRRMRSIATSEEAGPTFEVEAGSGDG